MDLDQFKQSFNALTNFKENQFHPFVWILGSPIIGKNVFIGGFSIINASESLISIGDNCDIASFVTINCADSHLKTIELSNEIARNAIILENNVFIGSHSVIKGGCHIGHHSVIAAATCVESGYIPPYSLVSGNPMMVKPGYYLNKYQQE